MTKFDPKSSLILLGEYGSVAQGTATVNSDHDYMAVFVEPPEAVIGLAHVDSVRDSDAAQGEKSAPGSSDTTYHTLRKFVKLAAEGNPTVGSILFLPEYEFLSELGESLVSMRDAFVSKKAGYAYLGYMGAQINAFTKTGRKNREELVEQYGYDIKFGYHAYRLGHQGIQMMTAGAPDIPLRDYPLEYAKLIRAGKVSKNEVVSILGAMENILRNAIDNSDLPEYADYQRINEWLIGAHESVWEWGIGL